MGYRGGAVGEPNMDIANAMEIATKSGPMTVMAPVIDPLPLIDVAHRTPLLLSRKMLSNWRPFAR